jgi:SAM-dependent methyltransferase
MSKVGERYSQSRESADANARFFLTNLEGYRSSIGSLDTYAAIHGAISREIAGIDHLLDVGNGGVFDYDTSSVGRITGIDLFLDQIPQTTRLPVNVEMEAGDALNLPKPANCFDGVLVVMLLHHLVGKSVAQCISNLERCVSEAARVLKPGGKMVIVESCVPPWFFLLEKVAFRAAVSVISKTISHPPTFQFTERLVSDVVAKSGLIASGVTRIPKGRYVLQFGYRVPSWVTPVQPTLFSAHKP